jgi:hypothetical protein
VDDCGKKKSERLRVQGAKGKKGLFPIGRREHGRHTEEKQSGKITPSRSLRLVAK